MTEMTANSVLSSVAPRNKYQRIGMHKYMHPYFCIQIA